MIFKKFPTDDNATWAPMPPLHWRYLTTHEKETYAMLTDQRPVAAIVSCKNSHDCALRIGVHTLSSEGVMTPSLQCPVDGCTGHEDSYSQLEGYAP